MDHACFSNQHLWYCGTQAHFLEPQVWIWAWAEQVPFLATKMIGAAGKNMIYDETSPPRRVREMLAKGMVCLLPRNLSGKPFSLRTLSENCASETPTKSRISLGPLDPWWAALTPPDQPTLVRLCVTRV